MVNPTTLESVTSAFDHWRSTRTSRKQAIPDLLRKQAMELLRDHKKAHVLSALKINHSMLKQWQQKNNEPTSSPTFVALAHAVPESDVSSTVQITLRHPLGSEMHVTCEMTPAQLSSLAHAFVSSQGSQS